MIHFPLIFATALITMCSNLYHEGESEEWVGEWMEARGNRDKIVLATKYSGFGDGEDHDINSMGNSFKSMSLGVRNSLKRLRTDYIDVYYVHFWLVYIRQPCPQH